jgi:hypothetical protein
LGDVFTSNYSRFALARLFGLGTDDFKVSENAAKEKDYIKVFYDTMSTAAKLSNLTKGQTFWLNAGRYIPKKQSTTLGIVDTLASGGGGKNSNEPLIIKEERFVKAKISNSPTNEDTITVKLDTSFSNNSKYSDNFGGNYIVNIDDLTPTEETYNILYSAAEFNAETFTDDINEINEFFGNKNAIVRSFESTAGKGLACTIDSLGIDHLRGNSAPWETESYGSRAPKILTINMSLSPIHDIPPGLDSNGFDRAPVYNVGDIVRGIGGDAWDDKHTGRDAFETSRTNRNSKKESKNESIDILTRKIK